MLIWGGPAFQPEPLSISIRFFKVSPSQEDLMALTTAVLCPRGRARPFSHWFPPEPGRCAQGWGERFRDREEREGEKEKRRKKAKSGERGGTGLKPLQALRPLCMEPPSPTGSNTFKIPHRIQFTIIYQFSLVAVCWLTMYWFCTDLIKHLIIFDFTLFLLSLLELICVCFSFPGP